MSTLVAGITLEPAGLGINAPADVACYLSQPEHKTFPSHEYGNTSIPHKSESLTCSDMRSESAMHGLLLAEVGDSMVELDPTNGGSGFKNGQRIALETLTPGGSSKAPLRTASKFAEEVALSRHGTLLSACGTPQRNAAELKSFLGNSSSKLRSGARLPPQPGQNPYKSELTSLEQAKPRARVEVDIMLENNICVEGGFLKGLIQVHIRKRSQKESAVMIAGGKVRIIGFETISGSNNRHVFYQCISLLSEVAPTASCLSSNQRDEEGFALAKEGNYTLPFTMYIPLDSELGKPKGCLLAPSETTLRYIAMVSIKVKDAFTDRRSIAHFYRYCDVWPRLNPSVILAPAAAPLRATASRTLFTGGRGKLELTAMVCRLHWVAGQHCYVQMSVSNDTKKTVKRVAISLLRSVVIFKPRPQLGNLQPNCSGDVDPDACQTSTTQREVAETTLEMGQHNTKGHASAKGWWTGVGPGEHKQFSHMILIPPDTLSIIRSRFLEVEYSLRVCVHVGVLVPDVFVALPLRIVNFISLDPPPSSPLDFAKYARNKQGDVGDVHMEPTTLGTSHRKASHPVAATPLVASKQESEVLAEQEYEDSQTSRSSDRLHSKEKSPSDYPGSDYVDAVKEGDYQEALSAYDTAVSETELGNLSIYDDSDEVVQHTISSARVGSIYGQNADLYYTSIQGGLDQHEDGVMIRHPEDHADETLTRSERSALVARHAQRQPDSSQPILRPTVWVPNAGSYHSQFSRPQGPSSFALRVQEKLKARAISNREFSPTTSLDPTSCDVGSLTELQDTNVLNHRNSALSMGYLRDLYFNSLEHGFAPSTPSDLELPHPGATPENGIQELEPSPAVEYSNTSNIITGSGFSRAPSSDECRFSHPETSITPPTGLVLQLDTPEKTGKENGFESPCPWTSRRQDSPRTPLNAHLPVGSHCRTEEQEVSPGSRHSAHVDSPVKAKIRALEERLRAEG